MGRQREEILRCLAKGIRQVLEKGSFSWDHLQEIRIRAEKPLMITLAGEALFIRKDGTLSSQESDYRVSGEEIRETMEYIFQYSRYAWEEQIRQGFVTIPGGHRVGLCGHVVGEAGQIKTILPIASINLRIARELPGCGKELSLFLRNQNTIYNTLILSGPGMGKTTLLRDLIRIFSEGKGGKPLTVGVVDERSELGACVQGVPQNDLGPRTDVLDGCDKSEGLMLLVRTMSPDLLAVDEVGNDRDFKALEYGMNCGCHLLATTHVGSMEELQQKKGFTRWFQEKRFQRYVWICREGKQVVYHLYDEEGRRVEEWGR